VKIYQVGLFAAAVFAGCLTTVSPAPAAESIYALAQRCSPRTAPRVVSAIAQIESGLHPYAVHDNTAGTAHYFASLQDAASFIRRRLAEGAAISGVGIVQINSVNFAGLGLSVEAALDPCTNVKYGMILLHEYYRDAVARYGQTTDALRWAFMAYNGGPQVFKSHDQVLLAEVAQYAASVWDTAVSLPMPARTAIGQARRVGRLPAKSPPRVEPSMSFQAVHAGARVNAPVSLSETTIQEQM
jgi:hypothetical protein